MKYCKVWFEDSQVNFKRQRKCKLFVKINKQIRNYLINYLFAWGKGDETVLLNVNMGWYDFTIFIF